MNLSSRTLAMGALVALPGLLASCKGGDGDTGLPYCPPTADAGANQSVMLGAAVNLDASDSGYGDSCQGYDLSFTWTFDSVPLDSQVDDSSLSDNGTESAEDSVFMPDLPGTYVLSLVVCDKIECSDPDVTVISVYTGDAAPVADAGDDVTVTVDERAQLDGSASYDPEGATLEFSWALVEVPACSALSSDSVYNAGSPTPTVIPDCEGFYQASLVVSDGGQWSEPAYVEITAVSDDAAPVADAGDSGTLEPCNGDTIALDGFGSYDPDGSPLEYLWTLVSVPQDSTATDANFDDPTAADAEFTWDVPGDYSFQLSVYDGKYWSAPDIVTYTVLDVVDNTRPVANAGDDATVELSAQCTSSSYTWTCNDCSETEVDLDGSQSFDRDGDELSYYWSESTGTLQIASAYAATTIGTIPAIAAEYGTTSTTVFEVQLDVADCVSSDSDSLEITVTCEGTSN